MCMHARFEKFRGKLSFLFGKYRIRSLQCLVILWDSSETAVELLSGIDFSRLLIELV